ncbi:Glycine betaine/carnitine/choline transport ATP-binding protein OpuCA, partial [Durusdinium trenchii]
ARDRAHELAALARLDASLLARFPHELSGGQRQRVALMRALASDPEALLLDEPLGALDPMVRADLQDELRALFERLDKTVVLVTHDLAEARHLASRVVLLHEGRIRTAPAAWVGRSRIVIRAAVIVLLCVAAVTRGQETLTIGSKSFTESVLLGELLAERAERDGLRVEHKSSLRGTRLVFEAVRSGAVDVYPEYTGTLLREVFADQGLSTEAELRDALADVGLAMSEPIGFNNTYAIGVMPTTAERLGLATISDLRRAPELTFGFTNEFIERNDGWRALRDAYGLPQANIQGIDHDLGYQALGSGAIDAKEIYTTDAKIESMGITVLADDLGHFPRYD